MRLVAVLPSQDLVANLVDVLHYEGYKGEEVAINDIDERVDWRDIDTSIDYQQEYDNDNSYVISLEISDDQAEKFKKMFADNGAREINIQ